MLFHDLFLFLISLYKCVRLSVKTILKSVYIYLGILYMRFQYLRMLCVKLWTFYVVIILLTIKSSKMPSQRWGSRWEVGLWYHVGWSLLLYASRVVTCVWINHWSDDDQHRGDHSTQRWTYVSIYLIFWYMRQIFPP